MPARSSSLELLASLRSVREFTDAPVSPEHVTQIIDVARWTGSARNRQPWRFKAVTDPLARRRLSRLGGYAQHLSGAPVVVVLLSADKGMIDTEFDLGRVAQTISLAAHALGLGSCLATIYPDENVAEASRVLGLGEGWLPRHAISIGWPAASSPMPDGIPRGRLPTQDLLWW